SFICALYTVILLHFLFLFLHTSPPSALSTLSLHDALPICLPVHHEEVVVSCEPAHPALAVPLELDLFVRPNEDRTGRRVLGGPRSEEHTSELQSRGHLVCRLLLEKKKKSIKYNNKT